MKLRQWYWVWLFICVLCSVSVNAQEVLVAGQSMERELKGGESHSYKISLIEGQYLHVMVEQERTDLVLTVFSPNGEKMIEVNSPPRTPGPEVVFLIARQTGDYKLEIHPSDKQAGPGQYKVKIAELRAAIAEDSSRVEA